MNIIYNIKLITEDFVIKDKAVIFDNKILQVIDEQKARNCEEYRNYNFIDGNGLYLSAGFIDSHVHGCGGYDAMDQENDCIYNMSKEIIKAGVTAFTPATMTMPMDRIYSAFTKIRAENVKQYLKNNDNEQSNGADVLGVHMEGPFISRDFNGAQNSKYILDSLDFSLIKDYIDIIKIITIAPELKGSTEFIKLCTQHGITVSIGHSGATYEQAIGAIEDGVSHITHTYNVMTPFHHRAPGIIGAAFLTDVYCEAIVDKVHLHDAACRILLNNKGIDNIILITDSMRSALLDDGEYEFGGQKVIVKCNEARLDNGKLAGSVLTLNNALKNFMDITGLEIHKAIKAVTINPAKALKVDKFKGRISPGYDADMVLFDDSISIKYTFVRGKKVYENSHV